MGSPCAPSPAAATSDVLSIIVPVRNEAATVRDLLRRVEAAAVPGMLQQIIVVDDGSEDETPRLLEALTADPTYVVLRHARGRGKGAAIRTALPHVAGSIVLIQDADLEYDPADHARLVEPIRRGEARVVYGSRFLGTIAGMRWMHRIANRALSLLADRLGRSRITDEATCYKAFSASLLRSLPLRCTGFEFCAEVTGLLQAVGEPIVEVPITYRSRGRASGKKVRARDGFVAVAWMLWARYGRRGDRRTLGGVRRRVTAYRWAVLALLAVALARALVENLRYPLLPGWDSWSFLGLAALVGDSGAIVPTWDTLQFQPAGRPFLYPPLVPVVASAMAGLSGLSAFSVIKGLTVLLYPALMVMVLLVARLAGDRRVALASVAFLLTVNQAFLLSLSALAQAVEMLLYLLVVLSLHRRRYVVAGVAYGLTFWTHTFTPLCFGLGLLLWAVLRREDRRRTLAAVAGGVLIGAPWLLRLAANAEWIRPNTQMDQHTTLSGWAWAVAVEGFAFVVLAAVLAGILLADRRLARALYRDRLASLLACTALGLALTSYYPERSLTYMAPAVSILLAIAVFRASPAAVRRGLWLGVLALAFVALDAFDVPASFTAPGHLLPILVATGVALLVLQALRGPRSLAVALLFVLLLTDPDGQAPPLAAWANPAQVARSRLPVEAWEACTWMAARHPGALVATNDFRMTAACNYKGLRTTTGTFMEFSRDGDIARTEGADYYLTSWGGDHGSGKQALWRGGGASVHRADPALRQVIATSADYHEPFGGDISGPPRMAVGCAFYAPGIELHAAPGQPPGMTYRWEVLDGAEDTVTFFPIGGPGSVGVSGHNAESGRRQLKIRLTYTYHGKSQQATKLVKLQRPSKLALVGSRREAYPPCGYKRTVTYSVRDQDGDFMTYHDMFVSEVVTLKERRTPGFPPYLETGPTTTIFGLFDDELALTGGGMDTCPLEGTWIYNQVWSCLGCPVRYNELHYGPDDVKIVETSPPASLAADLNASARALQQLGTDGLLTRGGFTIPDFDALTAGTLSVVVTAPSAPPQAAAAAARRVTIARARRSFARAGRYRVRVKLTKPGRRLLRRAPRVKVTLTLTFTDRSGKTTKRARKVTLRRSRAKR
jgi:dolichol-phosphate mannosyltransferase